MASPPAAAFCLLRRTSRVLRTLTGNRWHQGVDKRRSDWGATWESAPSTTALFVLVPGTLQNLSPALQELSREGWAEDPWLLQAKGKISIFILEQWELLMNSEQPYDIDLWRGFKIICHFRVKST